MAGRESGRIKDANQKRILDDDTRRRRQKKALEALEQDNFHEDPHADLGKICKNVYVVDMKEVMSKKLPKFTDELNKNASRKRKTRSAEYFKQRFRKNFHQLVEEDLNYNSEGPNYTTAQAPPSCYPERHFCAVCGFPSTYTCIPCGARYCSVKCLGTHLDTRCLKWTA